MGVEETNSLVMSSPTLVTPKYIEEVPVLEESIPIPIVHTEIAGGTKDIQVVEHPPIVQQGLDPNAINDPTDVQL